MNNVFKVMWSASQNTWVVCSELGRKGKTKSSTSAKVVGSLGLSLLLGATAQANSACNVYTTDAKGNAITTTANSPQANVCQLGDYTPIANDDKNGQATVDGAGNVIQVEGDAKNISAGENNSQTVKLADLSGMSYFLDDVEINSITGLNVLTTGQKTQSTRAPDPISGSGQTVSTYYTENLKDRSLGDESMTLNISDVGDNQYIDARFVTATNGGKANVDIAQDDDKIITMAAKQTSLMKAEDGGEVNWTGKNRFYFTTSGKTPPPTSTLFTTKLYDIVKYAGNVEFKGVNYVVNDDEGLRTYNDTLIKALEDGSFPTNGKSLQAAYDEAFAKAYSIQSAKAVNEYTPDATASANNDGIKEVGQQWVLHASGPDSVARIEGNLGYYRYSSFNSENGAMLIENGAKGYISKGELSGIDNLAVVKDVGSVLENKGIISVGYTTVIEGKGTTVMDRDQYWTDTFDWSNNQLIAHGVKVMDGGDVQNNGTINVEASRNNYGDYWVQAGLTLSNATATNGKNGFINVGVNNGGDGIAVGAQILPSNGKSTFKNEGQIYLGRGWEPGTLNNAAMATDGGASTAVDTSHEQKTYGILAKGTSDIIHSGDITIGSKIQNGVAINAENIKDSNITLNPGSTINILGNVANRDDGTPPLQNIGLNLNNTSNSQVSVGGDILIDGVNAIAVKLIDKSSAIIEETASISVEGGRDIKTGTRNYAVYAEGQNSEATASAEVKAKISLKDTGSIGVHARGYATVDVKSDANIFNQGSDQIGFFIYGPNAAINVAAKSMDVSTTNSTLYRVENGAPLDATGLTITTSGTNSVGILATGVDETTGLASKATVSSSNFNLSGENSNLLTVVGGAEGNIDNTNKVSISGKGAIIGIADGQKLDLYGNIAKTAGGELVSPNKETTLTSSVDTSNTFDNVTTYVARSSGNVVYAGKNIDLSGSNTTAFQLEDGGNVTVNEGAKINVKGDAIKSYQKNSVTESIRSATDNKVTFNGVEVTANNLFSAESGNLLVNTVGNNLLTGAAKTLESATSTLNINSTSEWRVSGDSNVTTLKNDGIISFTAPNNLAEETSYKTLTVKDYEAGNGARLNLYTSWDQPNTQYNDVLVITGSVKGITTVTAIGDIVGSGKSSSSIVELPTLEDYTEKMRGNKKASNSSVINEVKGTAQNNGEPEVITTVDEKYDSNGDGIPDSIKKTTVTKQRVTVPVTETISTVDVYDANLKKYDISSPVIKVLGTDTGENFKGSAKVKGSAAVAELVKIGNNYHWTLSALVEESDPEVITTRISNVDEVRETTTEEVIPYPPADDLTEPDNPTNPEQPDIPDTGDNPNEPTNPTNPEQPNTPDSGDNPNGQDNPTAPQPVIPVAVGLDKVASAYVQGGFISRQLGLAQLDKLHERVGEQQLDCNCVKQTWGRLVYSDDLYQGKNRFGFESRTGMAQIGHDLDLDINNERKVRTGVMVSYSWAKNKFYDKFNTVNGYVSDDKLAATGNSHAASIGAYRTAYYRNGSYLDLVGNLSWLRNTYKTDDIQSGHNGYSVGASAEVGRLFAIGESKWRVEPQAQLRALWVKLSDVNDQYRTTKFDGNLALQGRIGARLTNGKVYLSTNITHDFLTPKSRVNVGVTELDERYSRTAFDVAIGGDLQLDKANKWHLYGDVKYTRSLDKTSHIFSSRPAREGYSGRVGVRYSWK